MYTISMLPHTFIEPKILVFIQSHTRVGKCFASSHLSRILSFQVSLGVCNSSCSNIFVFLFCIKYPIYEATYFVIPDSYSLFVCDIIYQLINVVIQELSYIPHHLYSDSFTCTIRFSIPYSISNTCYKLFFHDAMLHI